MVAERLTQAAQISGNLGAHPKPAPSPVPAPKNGGKTQLKPVETKAKPLPSAFSVPKPVARARFRWSHFWALLSFLCIVVGPIIFSAHYLWVRAEDQYSSRVSFSVRKIAAAPTADLGLLGGLAGMGGFSNSGPEDGDILNEFLRSPQIVSELDRNLDLRSIWSPQDFAADPVFTFDPAGTIEDLVQYYHRMVRIIYTPGAGMITIEAKAFSAEDAQSLSAAILSASQNHVLSLGSVAQEDGLRLAEIDLKQAQDNLEAARTKLTAFRNRTQIVDPAASVQGQMGLLHTLQSQLAETMIRYDLLAETTNEDDPRIQRLNREIKVIESRVMAEKAKLGLAVADQNGDAYADIIGEYERLEVDREFAQTAYVSARAARDLARAEARRQSRYLVAHVDPTRAERSEYPRRPRILLVLGSFLLLGWVLAALSVMSFRDRK